MTNEEAIRVFESWIEHDEKMKYADRLENIEIYKMAIKALKERSIIHCKDCKFFRTPEKYSYKEPNLYCCRSALTKVSENDFCSKAIRKEGDEKC